MRRRTVSQEQSGRAASLASTDPRLDYSLASLAVVDQRLAGDSAAAHDGDVVAYVGEVILRATRGGRWTRDVREPNDNLLLVWSHPWAVVGPPDRGDHELGPGSLLRTRVDGRVDQSLVDKAGKVVAYINDPSEANAGALGLQKVGRTWAPLYLVQQLRRYLRRAR